MFLANEHATVTLAQRLAESLTQLPQKPKLAVVYLQGDLGAGKSFLVRALIQALGWPAAVKSPTYSLIESYDLAWGPVHHLDLYRLADPEELDYLGIRDLCAQDPSLLLIEWPSKGLGFLPEADLVLRLEGSGTSRELEMIPNSEFAQEWLKYFFAVG